MKCFCLYKEFMEVWYMNKIFVDEGLSWEQKKRAVEVSLINGFYSTSAKFPVISKEEGMNIPESLAELHKKYSAIPEKMARRLHFSQ